MNKYQRREIDGYIGQLEEIASSNELDNTFLDDINSIQSGVEIIRDDEQEKWDNMPENLQYSQRADDYEQIVDYLDSAIGYMDDASNEFNEDEPDWDNIQVNLNDAADSLTDAIGV